MMKNLVWKLVLILSLAIVAVSGVNVFKLSKEYKKGINEYKHLEQYVQITENESENASVQEEVTEESTEKLIDVSLDIQYNDLKKINDDIVGWLYYEPLDISYPVVRGDDNEYYTHYTFENEKNNSGAIFMDFLNKKDYSDLNTIIYGHNMRNGTMFGSLKKLLNDSEIAQENPYFYIFTDDKAYMYEIFTVFLTSVNSKIYDLVRTEEEEQTFLNLADQIAAKSGYRSDREVDASERVVTLSTCHGLHSTNRTVVAGVLIAEEER